jgi:DMSO reductase anchor subunit
VFRQATNPWLVKLAALVGFGAVFAMGMTYAPPSLMAIDNYLPFLFFLLTAVILGSAISSYFAPADKQALITGILAASLSVGLAVYLIVPSIWLSGGAVMRMSGLAYLTSPLYWTHIVVGFLLPLLILWRMKRIPVWLPLFLLVGEFAGRIIFFTQIVPSAANLGGLY